MYIYNDSSCHAVAGNKTQIYPQKECYATQKQLDEVFAFLDKTNPSTPYYKVIHKQDLQKCQQECREMVDHIQNNFETYVYLGMGGAILNAMMMYSIPKVNHGKKVHFINTTDPLRFKNVIDMINLKKTAFIVTSNSGETSETISLLGVAINTLKKAGIDFTKHCFLCVGDKDSALYKFTQDFNIPCVQYDMEVGGRFSTFSNAGILPAMLNNLDVEQLQKGANQIAWDFWQDKSASQPSKAAVTIFNASKPNLVTISYSPYLDAYLEWYCQIVSESLGKNKIGYTPLRGIGPQEQHSMLQLYLDGPQDKLYTLIYVHENVEQVRDIVVASEVFRGHFLEAKPLDTINRALFEATSRCLTDKSAPVRTLELSALDEENLGALIMHSSIEVVLLGRLMALNPFDQPGVEAIKIEAKRLLAA